MSDLTFSVTRQANQRFAMEPRALAWRLMLACPLIVGPVWMAVGGLFNVPATFAGGILIAMLAAATVTDMRWRLIPNWITYSCFLWALLINSASSLTSNTELTSQMGAIGIQASLVGAITIFILTIVFASITGGGGGDVKLCTCLGAFLGLVPTIDILLYSFAIGGVILVVHIIWLGKSLATFAALGRAFASAMMPMFIFPPTDEQRALLKKEVPLGQFFALGTLCYFCENHLHSLAF